MNYPNRICSAQSSYSGERGCWNMRYCIGLYGGGYGVYIMMSSALYIAASRFDDNFHIGRICALPCKTQSVRRIIKDQIERMFEDSGLGDRNYKRLIRNQCRRIWRKWIDK